MKKCVIIMNPESGKKKKLTTYQELYDILRKYDYDSEIFFTKESGDAVKIIGSLDDDVDLVLSAGGDGTLNEIVRGNLNRTKKLVVAPLPLGSTNDVGNMYGLDSTVYNNLEKILNGEKKYVDICKMNNTPFVYIACFGDYINMAYATPRELKKKYGRLAYLLFGARELRKKLHNYKIKYKVDGAEYEGIFSFIFISNSSRIAGQPDVYYDVKLDDNKFEVALANVKTKKELIKMLLLIDSIDVKDIPGITYYQTNNFEIEFITEPKTSWCLDGEEYTKKTNKYNFSIEQSMKMMIPKNNINKLFDN